MRNFKPLTASGSFKLRVKYIGILVWEKSVRTYLYRRPSLTPGGGGFPPFHVYNVSRPDRTRRELLHSGLWVIILAAAWICLATLGYLDKLGGTSLRFSSEEEVFKTSGYLNSFGIAPVVQSIFLATRKKACLELTFGQQVSRAGA